KHAFKIAGTRSACFAGAVLAIAGLASCQLLPFLELLQWSQRDADFGGTDWAMPATGWANFILPLYHCFTKFFGVPAQFGQYWTASYYSGIIVLGLASVSLVRVRDCRGLALGGLFLLSIILALAEATFLDGFFRAVLPQAGLFRYPVKWVVVSSFALPLLAAFGLAWMEKRPRNANGLVRGGGWMFGVLLLLVWILAWEGHRYPKHSGVDLPLAANAAGRTLCLLVGAGSLMVGLVSASSKWREIARGLCALAVVLDLKTHVPELNPTVTREIYQPGLIQDPAHPLHAGAYRGMTTPRSEVEAQRRPAQDPVRDFLLSRKLLLSNCNLLDGPAKVDGLFSLSIRDVDRIHRQLLYRTLDVPASREPLLNFLGVRTMVEVKDGALEWRLRPDAMPWITAGQGPRVSAAMWDVLADGAWNPRREVLFDAEVPLALGAVASSNAVVENVRWGNHEIEFTVRTSEPTLAVVAQAWYPPWRATVDEKPVRLLKGNAAFQALEVPAGTHRVRLRYEDRSFVRGCAISASSVVALVLLAPFASRRRRDGG
ncbi:MAG: hypothetical protein FJ404_07650, partial [Verrucomicrobia bacterium]|nr:hypothetical protein [Verrucomicrobiota bacterium]